MTRSGLEPEPLDPESSALTVKPPRLPHHVSTVDLWNRYFAALYQKPIRVETFNGPLCAGKQASEYSIC